MPNRSTELRWEGPRDLPLRRALIGAALEIADENGLDGVTVRAVAARVGCRPMSLYAHVPSKAGLLALMFERISGTLLVSEPLPADGKEALHSIATRAFEAYMAHPWMLHAFSHRPPPGPNQLRRADQSAAAVEALGVDEQYAWAVVSMVHDWTMGHALHVLTLQHDRPLDSALREAQLSDHPAAARALRRAPNVAAGEAFETNLDVLLESLQTRLAKR